jgi:hypothetical protein
VRYQQRLRREWQLDEKYKTGCGASFFNKSTGTGKKEFATFASDEE